MHCLVLGGAGFMGSHLVDALLARGHFVRILDRPNVSFHNLHQNLSAIEVVEGDFINPQVLTPAMADMDVVIHLISTTLPVSSNLNPVYDVESNVIGSLNLLKEAVRLGVRKVIFASSGGTVYGIPECLPIPETHPTNPICSYGISKLTIEKFLFLYHHLHGLNYTILRFGNPYGPRQRSDSPQGVVGVFMGKILKGETITIWGDGSIARDYFHISDLVSAMIRVTEEKTESKVYNIAGGRAWSLNEIIHLLGEITGMDVKVAYSAQRKMDVPVNCLAIDRARRELNWQPEIAIEEGLLKTWQWFQKLQPRGSRFHAE
jgi:UDP-glucose 4-epimerase